jgi:hypothetical protein
MEFPMIRSLACVCLFALAVSAAEPKPEPQIGHMVFFKLKDNSEANQKKLVDACNKYLSIHEGTAYYSAGARGKEFKRDVNDQDWDVALHLVFTTKAAHDKYATHPEHLKFIDENKAGWEKVRVFDSEVWPMKK